MSRAQKALHTKQSLLRAAEEIVGERGYAEASITLITERAGVAHGTFYSYFASRQEIFDTLLPAIGSRMRRYVALNIEGGTSLAELEEMGLKAFLEFLQETPHFFRILNEAPYFAPKAHAAHFQNIVRGYRKFLRKWQKEGYLSDFHGKELDVVVYMLMAARIYLAIRLEDEQKRKCAVPDWIVSGYSKFLRHGISGQIG